MISETAFIKAENIHFGFEKKSLIQDVSLSLEIGSFGALLGQNGAGKSTLLKILSGYLKPSQGKVSIGGKDIHTVNDEERSRLVTYVGQAPSPSFDFSVEETVAMGRITAKKRLFQQDPKESLLVQKALDIMSLGELKDRPVTSLSSGEYQRVEMARALCQDPQALLLDEPTAHLDVAYEMEVMEIIKSLAKVHRKTVLAVFHDLNLALRYASRLFFLKDGKILFDITPDEVDPKVIRDVFQVDVKLDFEPEINGFFAVPIGSLRKKPV